MSKSFAAQSLGIDFGTSNSAVGIYVDQKPKLIEIEEGQTTVPTSEFLFDFSNGHMRPGCDANKALIGGCERGLYAIREKHSWYIVDERRTAVKVREPDLCRDYQSVFGGN